MSEGASIRVRKIPVPTGGDKIWVFRRPSRAENHIRNHLLEPLEAWWEVTPKPFPSKWEFRRALGTEIGQTHYDVYVGAIERALQDATATGLWQEWEIAFVRGRLDDSPPPPKRFPARGRTWISLAGVRVESTDNAVTTALRHRASVGGGLDARGGMPPRAYDEYRRFRDAHIRLLERANRPWRKVREREGLFRFERVARERESPLLRRGMLNSAEWQNLRQKPHDGSG